MARFDESANIKWAEAMEEAGIHVTYGVVGLKTHCKAIYRKLGVDGRKPAVQAARDLELL